MNKLYQTIHSTEIDDFKQSCQHHSVDYNEFKLEEHDITSTYAGNGLYHPHGKVTISRNGKSMTYITGHSSKWPAEFDVDLKNGVFV